MAPSVHIAGIGSSLATRNEALGDLAVAAGTKALLDAGLTYSSVDQSIACFIDERDRMSRTCFDVFGHEGAPACEFDASSGIFAAAQSIRSGTFNCVLVVGPDRQASNGSRATEPVAVAVVLVSNLFLTSHAYLKDSSVRMLGCSLASRIHSRSANQPDGARTVRSAVQSALRQAHLQPKALQLVQIKHDTSQQHLREALEGVEATQPREPWTSGTVTSETGWLGLCRLVYQLRGWATDAPVPNARNCLQFVSGQDGSASAIILARSDARPAPVWQDIKDVRDGRERLGYNPASEVRPIAQEDLEAVRARAEFTSDADLARLGLPIKGGDRAALARL